MRTRHRLEPRASVTGQGTEGGINAGLGLALISLTDRKMELLVGSAIEGGIIGESLVFILVMLD
jgi:hypothetical protein